MCLFVEKPPRIEDVDGGMARLCLPIEKHGVGSVHAYALTREHLTLLIAEAQGAIRRMDATQAGQGADVLQMHAEGAG
jgi:hypothetical protein